MAERYERFRPGYPDGLVDLVLDYAGRPLRTALEIGAGTGKATRAFVSRGIRVIATDPDEAMLDELRRHVPHDVETVTATLEELSPRGTTVDLVYAAASLHWTRPTGRWDRVAALLDPDGGVFASFGGQPHLADRDVDAAVRAARRPDLPEDGIPSSDETPPDDPLQWPGTELVDSAWFTDVRQFTVERRSALSADAFVGYLSTVSAYLLLPDRTRDEVLRRIRGVLPDEVLVVADVVAHLARRRQPPGG